MRSCKMAVLVIATVIGFAGTALAVDADDGAKVYKESCAPCHTAKIRPLENTHLTKEQWKDAVDRMIDQGAEVPKAKMQELLDYLVDTHGPTGTTTDAGKK